MYNTYLDIWKLKQAKPYTEDDFKYYPWWKEDELPKQTKISLFNIEVDSDNNELFISPEKKWRLLMHRYIDHPKQLKILLHLAKEIFPDINQISMEKNYQNRSCPSLPLRMCWDLDEYIKSEGITFKEFITNPAYVAIICTRRWAEHLEDAGLLNSENIESCIYGVKEKDVCVEI